MGRPSLWRRSSWIPRHCQPIARDSLIFWMHSIRSSEGAAALRGCFCLRAGCGSHEIHQNLCGNCIEIDGVSGQAQPGCPATASPYLGPVKKMRELDAALRTARRAAGLVFRSSWLLLLMPTSAALSISSRGSSQLELAASDAKAGWAGMSLLEGGADNSQEWALPGVFPQP